MADDLAALEQRLLELASVLPTEIDAMLVKIGEDAKDDILTSVRADLGGDTRFSGWPKAPISVGFKLVGVNSIEIGVSPASQGPMKVAERGRRAGKKMSTKRGRVVGWGPTGAKRTWSDGIDPVMRDTSKRALAEISDRVRKILL